MVDARLNYHTLQHAPMTYPISRVKIGGKLEKNQNNEQIVDAYDKKNYHTSMPPWSYPISWVKIGGKLEKNQNKEQIVDAYDKKSE